MATARKPKKTPPARPAAKKEKPAAPPLGRYLRRFTLQNVRTFRSPVTLDFCREDGSVAQWTVILGENGTGKTTLLQYLAGMVPVDEMDLKTQIKYWPTIANSDWVAWHAANVSSSLCSPEKEAQLEASLEISSPADCLEKAIFHEDKDTHDYSAQFKYRNERLELQGARATQSADTEKRQQLRLFGYGAARHIAGPASPYLSSESFQRRSISEPTGTLYEDDLPLISPEQWFLGLDHTSRGVGDYARRAKRAFVSGQRCLVQVLPDLGAIVVKPRATGIGGVQMTLVCETPYGEVPFGALSVGYRTMAAWLTDFVKRMHEAFPDLDEPDDGPAVVLIDEFDLHMHPKWQREAMAALSKEFPNTQFIVTAHSPLIVQATEGHAKLIVLRRSKRADGTEEVLVDDHPRYAAGWRVDQILSSDLYGMDPRSPKYDALMEESIRLRQKERRTVKEERRLTEIEAELEQEAPPGTSSASKQLLADLERALEAAHANGK